MATYLINHDEGTSIRIPKLDHVNGTRLTNSKCNCKIDLLKVTSDNTRSANYETEMDLGAPLRVEIDIATY